MVPMPSPSQESGRDAVRAAARLQAALLAEDGELVGEQWLVGVAVQEDGLPGRVVQALGQGAQRCDADARRR